MPDAQPFRGAGDAALLTLQRFADEPCFVSLNNVRQNEAFVTQLCADEPLPHDAGARPESGYVLGVMRTLEQFVGAAVDVEQFRFRQPLLPVFFDRRQVVTPPEQASKLASFIPFDTFRKSLSRYGENNFIRYLHTLFRPETVGELVRRFYVGTSKHWEGATAFWQVDVKGHIRSGKVMHYDPATGRRVKGVKPDGSKRSRITWAHSVLLKQGVFQDFKLRQCLFGEHQLAAQPKTKPVAVVEAEKTAIRATSYLPDLIWLACGSLTNLTADKCAVLAGRKVILFPDLKCLKKWHDKAKQLQALIDCSITVSDLLETRAAEADKEQGFDLADYLVSYDAGSGSPRSYGGWGHPA